MKRKTEFSLLGYIVRKKKVQVLTHSEIKQILDLENKINTRIKKEEENMKEEGKIKEEEKNESKE